MPAAERLRRVAVITRTGGEGGDMLPELVAEAGRLGVELLLPAEERDKHHVAGGAGFTLIADDELRQADLCVVLGGDGTILRALGRLLGSGVPTVGINFGSVGFLAAIPRDTWKPEFERIVGGTYSIIDLLTVEARHDGQVYPAVNDIVLARPSAHRVLRLRYGISGTPVGEMLCDGLIAASPTGSTAYNLSCFGPLVVWDADALVLNFIAPHSLGFRPLVLRTDHVIDVRNDSPADEAVIMADGRRVGEVRRGQTIEIAAGASRARLMIRAGDSFYGNVEEKLFIRAPHAR